MQKLNIDAQLESIRVQMIRLQAQADLLTQIKTAGGVIELPEPAPTEPAPENREVRETAG
jgi:hypothetical protein